MARFLYFLIMLVLARMAWNALNAWLADSAAKRRMGGGADRRSASPGMVNKGLMVRDPVCGLHLPATSAISVSRAGKTLHFCSEQCRQSFVEAS